MKKKLKTIIAIILVVVLLGGCGNNMIVDGKEIRTFGLIGNALNDESIADVKQSNIKYKIIWGNVFWGIVLFETIVMPVYFFGFSIFEPIGEMEAKYYDSWKNNKKSI